MAIPRHESEMKIFIHPQRDLYKNVHSSFIHNSSKLEWTQIKERIKNKVVINSYNRLLPSNKEKQTISSVQSLSPVRLFATPWITACQASLSITNSWSLVGVYPNSCPLSQWCLPAISSSLVPFFSCPQSLPAWGSFLMSQLFAWGGRSIGVSASASVLPMNTRADLL